MTASAANQAREVVLVTGSSGCLGHQTARLLAECDQRVREIRCLDLVDPSQIKRQELDEALERFEKANCSSRQRDHQETAPGSKRRIKFIKGDIRDINLVERALVGVHSVIHCAAKQDFWHEPGEQDEQELETTNVQGTENLLKTCVRLGVPKFVHVSSFETFVSFHTIYYATESTIPEPKHLLFGPSASSKRSAELKVRQYANVKLKEVRSGCEELDSLRAVIVRFTPIYGEHDQHYVTKLLEMTKFFGGKLQRFTNIWIRQQPIYVGNAAWSLVQANRRLDVDETISGEEFHITDETSIGDPFDFMEPFAQCRGMEVSKSTFPAWPVWFLLVFFSFMRGWLRALDIFGLFTSKRSRLDDAIELDERRRLEQLGGSTASTSGQPAGGKRRETRKRWHHYITPQNFYFMCNSLFLNRTKASLRLRYEPKFNLNEAMERSLDWYKNQSTV